jgi:hypothetical protein
MASDSAADLAPELDIRVERAEGIEGGGLDMVRQTIDQ